MNLDPGDLDPAARALVASTLAAALLYRAGDQAAVVALVAGMGRAELNAFAVHLVECFALKAAASEGRLRAELLKLEAAR